MILQIEPRRILQYTHFSPLSGLADSPENYHTVTIGLSAKNGATTVSLSQDNNATEQEREHSRVRLLAGRGHTALQFNGPGARAVVGR